MKKNSDQYFEVSLEERGSYQSFPDLFVAKKMAKSKSFIKVELGKLGLYANNRRMEIEEYSESLNNFLSTMWFKISLKEQPGRSQLPAMPLGWADWGRCLVDVVDKLGTFPKY